MTSPANPIHFKVKYGEEVYDITTRRFEYRNLMVLLNNCIYLENFGDCGGQGRCATCIIKISGLQGAAAILLRNEKQTLQKAGLSNSGVRLACQVLITEDLQGAIIEIVEGY